MLVVGNAIAIAAGIGLAAIVAIGSAATIALFGTTGIQDAIQRQKQII